MSSILGRLSCVYKTFSWNWCGRTVGSGIYGSEGNEIRIYIAIETMRIDEMCMKDV